MYIEYYLEHSRHSPPQKATELSILIINEVINTQVKKDSKRISRGE